MLLAIIIAAIVLLQVVSKYAFIHILLGTATVCVLVRLVYRPPLTEELSKESCVPLPN